MYNVCYLSQGLVVFLAALYSLKTALPWLNRPILVTMASRLVPARSWGHGSCWCLTGRVKELEQGVHITMDSGLLRRSNTSHFPVPITSRTTTTPASYWTSPSADVKENLISQRPRSLKCSCTREVESSSLYWNVSPSQIPTLRLISLNSHPYELS